MKKNDELLDVINKNDEVIGTITSSKEIEKEMSKLKVGPVTREFSLKFSKMIENLD